ncbi:unnamed protein product [Rotaria sordida]|uniref:Mannose-P-dolichol utilization defect 1 protein homolog n=1 Tax=Rotaria sordida TaxID=392033 RepID=A0A814LTB3_9BILA|nr:unnamed protein product [Rotaria sordida]
MDESFWSSLESIASKLLSPHCYDQLVLKQQFFDFACNKMLLSKMLGYAILIGSLLVKFPQIVKIYWNKSGVGVSVLAETIMLAAIFGSMAYGYTSEFPISAYGDSYFLFIQTILVILLVLYYKRKYTLALIYLVLCVFVTVLMYEKLLPARLVGILAGLSLVLSLISRLWQSFCIYKAKSTGNLSALTMLMLFFGSLARIFTSIEETGDPTLIWTYILNSFANFLLVFQLGYYWSAPASDLKEKMSDEAVIEDEPEDEQQLPSSRPQTETGLLTWSYAFQLLTKQWAIFLLLSIGIALFLYVSAQRRRRNKQDKTGSQIRHDHIQGGNKRNLRKDNK